jgi:hypothetical protein
MFSTARHPPPELRVSRVKYLRSALAASLSQVLLPPLSAKRDVVNAFVLDYGPSGTNGIMEG